MIGVRFKGRLGNQLFQYAAARSVAERLNCPLVVTDFARGRNLRRVRRALHLELREVFPNATVAPATHALEALGGISARAYRAAMSRMLPRRFTPRKVLSGGVLSSEAFDPAIREVSPGTLLEGFFQSEAYFADRREDVRRWFAPAERTTARVGALLEPIASDLPTYVAVHVRLGDYQRHALQVGGRAYPYVLDRAYYAAAIDMFPRDTPIALFSDEPEMAAELLPRPAEWVAPDADPFVTLLALATFSKIVTANSSFSWWAAWLGGPDNVVIAPRFHIGHAAGIWHPYSVAVDRWTYV